MPSGRGVKAFFGQASSTPKHPADTAALPLQLEPGGLRGIRWADSEPTALRWRRSAVKRIDRSLLGPAGRQVLEVSEAFGSLLRLPLAGEEAEQGCRTTAPPPNRRAPRVERVDA